MKIALTIISVLMILFGSVFFLQGMNVLGGSRMSGQPQWVFNGAVIAILGIGLLLFTYWRRGARPKN
jgi:hypothetical protein